MMWSIGVLATTWAVEPPADTGEVLDTGMPAAEDTAPPRARSAAELAGETGGCRCSSSSPYAPWLGGGLGLLVVARRRVGP
ncbi:MAG: hypothetical protein AAGA48_24035 [Myxococcota bacterium]